MSSRPPSACFASCLTGSRTRLPAPCCFPSSTSAVPVSTGELLGQAGRGGCVPRRARPPAAQGDAVPRPARAAHGPVLGTVRWLRRRRRRAVRPEAGSVLRPSTTVPAVGAAAAHRRPEGGRPRIVVRTDQRSALRRPRRVPARGRRERLAVRARRRASRAAGNSVAARLPAEAPACAAGRRRSRSSGCSRPATLMQPSCRSACSALARTRAARMSAWTCWPHVNLSVAVASLLADLAGGGQDGGRRDKPGVADPA